MAALTSLLFRDIRRLQECATIPSSHVTLKDPPESGEHVEAIQSALRRLGFDAIEAPELLGYSYGASTAEMVRRFKESEHILGPGQVKVDNIVGILTIRRLDALMGGLNNGPGADPNTLVFDVNPSRILKAKVFWLSSAFNNPPARTVLPVVQYYQAVATTLLSRHNMRCVASPSSPESFVPFEEALDDFVRGPTGVLSRAREAVGNVPPSDGIVVIVGRFKRPFSTTAGLIAGHTAYQNLPFFSSPTTIFLNAHASSPDHVTLLHEMGHAAGADAKLSEADWQSEALEANIMSHRNSTVPRIEMMRWQGEALANSSFAFADG